MLNKNTKQQAEKMAQELAPMFAKAHKLGEILTKQARQTRHASNVAHAWQYPTSEGYAKDCGENSQEIQRIRNENPHEWHNILDAKYLALDNAQQLEQLARLNYRNYIAYICKYIGYLLHHDDAWVQFYEKRGIESLCEQLKPLAGKGASLTICRDGTSWAGFGADDFYCYLQITFWGVCCVRATDWATYRELAKQERPQEWEKPQEPKRYTFAQYLRIIKELKELENKAKAAARAHHNKAQETGLIYFVGGLADPQMSVWGKND